MKSEGASIEKGSDDKELTLENINRAMKMRTPMRVKVRRTSGAIEDDWNAIVVHPESGVVLVDKITDEGIHLKKSVPLSVLQEWNKEPVSAETVPVDQESPKADKSEILKTNLNTLIELFQNDERSGRYDADPELVNTILRTIQKHTDHVEGRNNIVGDPEAFLIDLHAARDQALEEASDDAEREKIRELFGHVDIT